jgi:transposase
MQNYYTSPDETTYRINTVDRDAVIALPTRIDALIPDDHPARLVWAAVESLDLSALHVNLTCVAHHAGRPATDPKILLAVWLFGLSNGVIEGRELARLCVEHVAYLWVCGDVATNYQTLNDFRVDNAKAIDRLFVQILGRLIHAGLADLSTVAHDGMRLRAAAGIGSFHRAATIDAALAKAQSHLREVTTQPPADASSRRAAANKRAAEERVVRLERARQAVADLANPPPLPASADDKGASSNPPRPLKKKKKRQGRDKEPRASTADPDARVMRCAEGGFRPAYNEQVVVETSRALIVSVEVTTNGSDQGQTIPAFERVSEIAEECAVPLPTRWLTDGGFVKTEAVQTLATKGTTLVGPLPDGPSAPMNTKNAIAQDWCDRMATSEMKELYKRRAATIELRNARVRKDFGLSRLPVRGLQKVRCFLTLLAIAYNVIYGLIPSLSLA